MMASVIQTRPLAGVRAFGSTRPRAASHIAHNSAYGGFTSKNRSFMVEVEVGEDEPEDVAVRRYMKLVMQSRVVEKLRARKVKETKIEEYKRRFRERVEMRKAGIVEPTYDELYNADLDPRPFDDFFSARDPDDPEAAYDGLSTGAEDIFGSFGGGSYVDSWATYGSSAQAGGYMPNNYGSTNNWQGGYM